VWPRSRAALPLALGIFQLLVVTPVALGAGFASVAAFLVITAQDLLVALLGWQLARHDPDRRPVSAAGSARATPRLG
jgi:hypothetical protein